METTAVPSKTFEVVEIDNVWIRKEVQDKAKSAVGSLRSPDGAVRLAAVRFIKNSVIGNQFKKNLYSRLDAILECGFLFSWQSFLINTQACQLDIGRERPPNSRAGLCCSGQFWTWCFFFPLNSCSLQSNRNNRELTMSFCS